MPQKAETTVMFAQVQEPNDTQLEKAFVQRITEKSANCFEGLEPILRLDYPCTKCTLKW